MEGRKEKIAGDKKEVTRTGLTRAETIYLLWKDIGDPRLIGL